MVLVIAVAAIAIRTYLANDATNQARACEHAYQTVQAGLRSYMSFFNVSSSQSEEP